jgi:hypothetical protein
MGMIRFGPLNGWRYWRERFSDTLTVLESSASILKCDGTAFMAYF